MAVAIAVELAVEAPGDAVMPLARWISWASASVHGRTVTLTGVPASHEARLAVVALVRKVPGVSR